MRRARGLFVVLICATAAVGCFNRPFTRPAEPTRARSIGPVPAPDGLRVESVLLERPVGDPYLDRELWASAIPPLTPERRALLAENGLRVGLLTGDLPAPLQNLLASDADAVSARRLTFAARPDAVLPTAGPIDPCAYRVLTDLAAERIGVQLRQAAAGICVRPVAGTGDRVKVWCEPHVQHGERRDWLRPSADGTQFLVHGEVPTERYPTLGFEVSLGPGDVLVVGSPADSADTLGATLFAVEAAGRPRQRVLVIRAGSGDAGGTDLPAIRNLRGRPSVAAEAGRR